MNLIIRPATPNDAKDIINLLNPIILGRKNTAMTELISEQEQTEFISSFPVRGLFLVAESNNRVVGIQDVTPVYEFSPALRHVGDIATFVHQQFHGQSIGQQLMKATKEQALNKGYKKLTAMIRADNAAGLNYYLAHGFKEIGRASAHVCIDGQYIDEVMTECILDDSILS